MPVNSQALANLPTKSMQQHPSYFTEAVAESLVFGQFTLLFLYFANFCGDLAVLVQI